MFAYHFFLRLAKSITSAGCSVSFFGGCVGVKLKPNWAFGSTKAFRVYRRYIETADKKAARDFTIVSNRIDKVSQLLSAQYVRAIAESEDSEGVRIRKSYAELDQKVAVLNKKNETLASSNETLRAEIRRLNNKIDNQLLWIKRIQSSPTDGANAGKLDSVTVTDADGKEKILQTYEVRKGDSLSVIAEYVYGDRTMWPRIRDANPDKVKNGDRVKPGDILIIP